jgi:hypothetical protein
VDVLIPTLFNFPSVAMILLLSFVLFAGWYAGNPVPASRYPLFASAALLLAFGGSNVAIPKLLEILRLPSDLFELFLVANVINNFFFQALAASSLVVCTLLTLLLVKRRIKLRPVNLGALALVTVLGVPAVLTGLAVIFDRAIGYEYRGYEEFVDREAIYRNVRINQVDIYASGLLLEPRRERAFAVSEPYTEISLGLLVRDHERRAIEARGRFIGKESEKIGVLNAPSIRRAIKISAPGILTEPVASPRDFLRGNRPDLSYLVTPAESAAAWAMVYPDFSVVVPSSRKVRIPMVFALPAADSDWAKFIDQWITTSQSVGITDSAYRYWILGESVSSERKRWSVIRDVLGWVD